MLKFDEFKESLKQHLNDLPGIEAQLQMAPITRLEEMKKLAEKANPRLSAVLILFYPLGGKIKIAMMKRPVDNTVHSGQVSFPGGKYEEQDTDLKATALREAWEELGIPQKEVDVIGNLTKLFIPPSNFEVHPWIGFMQNQPEFKLSIDEVDLLIEADLETLLQPETFTNKDISHRTGKLVNVPCFYLDDQIIWGATAMILSELVFIINRFYKL